MESASTPAPDDPRPPDDGSPGPRRLLRARTDRVLGGVCAGLGRYFGIDPVLVRVLAAVLVLLGGAGLVAYLAMVLLVPEEPVGSEDATMPLPPHRQLTAGAVALIIIAMIVGAPFLIGGGFAVLGLAIPLGIVGLTGLGTWWLVTGDRFVDSPGRMIGHALLGLLVLTGAWLLFAAGFLGTGFGGGVVTGAAVIAAGVVLLIGAFAGRVRWVVLPALALALGASASAGANVDLRGGAGERDYRPVDHVADRYEVGLGQLVVDLRGARLRRGDTHLKMRVGMGEGALIVPRDVCVSTHADMGAGNVEVFGHENGGFDFGVTDERRAGRSGKRVVVDADIGFGQLVVGHDRGILGDHGPRGFRNGRFDNRFRRADRVVDPDRDGNTGCRRAA